MKVINSNGTNKQVKIMKKLLLTIAAFSSIYFIFGCTETNQLAGPDNNVTVVEQPSSPAKLTWVTLPEPFNKSLRKSWSAGEYIPIGGSGSISIQDQYEGGIHGLVTVNATIQFNTGSINPNSSYYEGINYQFNSDSTALWSTFAVGDDACTANFSPHIMFDTPATLNLTFTGIDLTGKNESNVIFVYQVNGTDQGFEPVYGSLNVDEESGTLSISNAVIPHFSRFGFVN